ncbi:phosphoglycerate mutase 2 [Drosophila tropicalis]|uniref:phosphoglycerate mutase 2 n=1 Tax=Drosophila tropicalis TaxID=46794 RepID=UPI0035ABD995
MYIFSKFCKMALPLRNTFHRLVGFKSFRFYCKDSQSSGDEAKAKYKIVMVRHGESEWNKKNLFCGWYDAALSEGGLAEACSAGTALRKAKLEFDIAHTSVLKRANDTLMAILLSSGHKEIPIRKTWRLNERHYGGLTGLNKTETAKKFGEEKVQIWRRSFDTPPPPMEEDHKYYNEIRNDARYCENGPEPEEFPKTESLKLTIERTLPYWDEVIVPQIREGKRIIIVAHGNSLRGVVKHLDEISDEAIMGLNIPTGLPFVYDLDECIKPVGKIQFLGDPETVKKAMESVANQGKAK